MPDTFESCWREVRLHCEFVPDGLAQHWIRNRFRDLIELRLWSWALNEAQFTTVAEYKTGTITLTNGSTTVTGASTVWTNAMAGRQLKAKNYVFTVASVTNGTSLELDRLWPEDTVAAVAYTILQAYVTAATDLKALHTVIDPANNWRLWTHYSQSELDTWDPARSSTGTPAVLADLRYNSSGVPMFELWPHVATAKGFRYLYWNIPPDISRLQALPYTIRGDVLVKGALADLCKWPGTPERPNPSFNLMLSRMYEAEFATKVADMERNDQEIYLTDAWYDLIDLPRAPLDANFIRSHAY